MNLRTGWFSVIFLFVWVNVIPAAAQDAPPSRPPCTADEVTMIADIATDFDDQLNAVVNKEYDQTLDGDTAKLVDWLALYQSFLLNEFPGVPNCVDGVVYGNTVGITLNQQMTLQGAVLLVNIRQAAKNSDAALSEALSDLVQVQSETAEAGMSAISALVTQMQAGVASPEWLPACTAEQLQFTTQIDDFEQTFASLQGGLRAYMDTGTVDNETYFGVTALVTDMAAAINAVGADVCADYYFRALDDAYKFGDTFTALTMGLAAPAITGNEQFDAMHQWMNAFADPALNWGL